MMIYPQTPIYPLYPLYWYSSNPFVNDCRIDSRCPALYPYTVTQSDYRHHDSSQNDKSQCANSSLLDQHQGATSSLGEAGRHYFLDTAPDWMEQVSQMARQMATMWLRDIQNRASVRRDEIDARPLPNSYPEAGKTLASNVLQGASRFFA